MRLHELIKNELNNTRICDDNGEIYNVEAAGDECFSITVVHKRDKDRSACVKFGDKGNELLIPDAVDFSYVGKGVFCRIIREIGRVVPVGTKLKSAAFGDDDLKRLSEYLQDVFWGDVHWGHGSFEEVLEKLELGRILLVSSFDKVKIIYKKTSKLYISEEDGGSLKEYEALFKFLEDYVGESFHKNADYKLILVGTKTKE